MAWLRYFYQRNYNIVLLQNSNLTPKKGYQGSNKDVTITTATCSGIYGKVGEVKNLGFYQVI